MVPVIKDAGDLNLAGIAKKTAELAGKVRDGGLTPDDMSGGTFTISNTGSRGALFDTVIVPPNQVADPGHRRHRQASGGHRTTRSWARPSPSATWST